MAETDKWPEDDYDYDAAPDNDCLHEDASIDILDGRGSCHCGYTWWLSSDEIKAEAKFMAEYAESVAAEMTSGELMERKE